MNTLYSAVALYIFFVVLLGLYLWSFLQKRSLRKHSQTGRQTGDLLRNELIRLNKKGNSPEEIAAISHRPLADVKLALTLFRLMEDRL